MIKEFQRVSNRLYCCLWICIWKRQLGGSTISAVTIELSPKLLKAPLIRPQVKAKYYSIKFNN